MNLVLQKVLKNHHQKAKWEQLAELASEVENGVIVELGTYLGYGAIALCDGAKVPVYTVDDYRNRKGWAGEVYYPDDQIVAQRNFIEANVWPSMFAGYDARLVGNNWHPEPIGLLFWDLGVPARLCEDFAAWERHITGKFVIHDTEDNRLGSDLLKPERWEKKKEGVFWILQKS